MDPKMDPELVQKPWFWGPFLDPFFLRFRGSLGASWEPSWASWGSLGRPLDPKNLKKPTVFQGFWRCSFLVLWSSWWPSWAHLAPFLGRSGPKMAPKMVPKVVQNWFKKWAQKGTRKGPQNDPKIVPKIIGSGDPFLVLLGVIFGILAKRAQDGAKMVQKGAKMAPDRPKTGPRSPQIGPRWSKTGPK